MLLSIKAASHATAFVAIDHAHSLEELDEEKCGKEVNSSARKFQEDDDGVQLGENEMSPDA
jgi:hypothetical protein